MRITQEARFRQKVCEFVLRKREKGKKQIVAKAMARFHIGSRKIIYDWLRAYDGTAASLMPKSRRPLKPHPKAHTPEEESLIREVVREVFLEKSLYAPNAVYTRLRMRGYARTYGGMKRFVRKKIFIDKSAKKKPKNKWNPFPRKEYPGQKIQIDVKYAPSENVSDGNKYYQYTAVDECTRWTFREMYNEHSTYSSKQFLESLIRNAPFPILEVQTDNGTEFTAALLSVKPGNKSLFESALEQMEIKYHRIRIATPQHNGKVERQHREDQRLFYTCKLRIHSLADGRGHPRENRFSREPGKKLAAWNAESNDILRGHFGWRSPNDVLGDYLAVM